MICSKYDLYSKSKVLVDVDEVKPYYQSLIKKVTFFPSRASFLNFLTLLVALILYI